MHTEPKQLLNYCKLNFAPTRMCTFAKSSDKQRIHVTTWRPQRNSKTKTHILTERASCVRGKIARKFKYKEDVVLHMTNSQKRN